MSVNAIVNMRKSSTTNRRRSSSNPGRFSQQEQDRNSLRMDPRRPQNVKAKDSNFGSRDSMIPKPQMRSSSSDRLSGMRKSNFNNQRPTTGNVLCVIQVCELNPLFILIPFKNIL